MIFQTAPRAVALAASTAAPWVILVAGGVAFLIVWPVVATLAQLPGANLVDLALAAGGRPLAIGLALLLGSVLVYAEGISLRETSEMLVTAIFPYTPQTFGMASLVAAGALGAATSPKALVWHGSLYARVALGVGLVLLVGNIPWGQFRNVLPLTGPGIVPALNQVLPLTSYFGELVCFAVLTRYLATSRHLVRSTGLVVGAAALTWAAVVLVYLMVLPLPGGLSIPFPLFEMTRLVQGGRFLERLDALWMLFWTLGSAELTSVGLMLAALLFKDAFRLPDHRPAVLPLAVAMLAAALFPANQDGAIAEAVVVRRWGFLITLVLPLLVALVARLRWRVTLKGRGTPGTRGDARG